MDSVMSFGYGNVVSSKNEGYSNFLAYPDSLINDFKPELESGDWLDKKTQSDDEIEIVVSKNPYGWKTWAAILTLATTTKMGKYIPSRQWFAEY